MVLGIWGFYLGLPAMVLPQDQDPGEAVPPSPTGPCSGHLRSVATHTHCRTLTRPAPSLGSVLAAGSPVWSAALLSGSDSGEG